MTATGALPAGRGRAATVLVVLALVVASTPLAALPAAATTATTETPTVSISEIQTPDGDGTASPYAGQNVTTTGTVTATTGSGFFLQDGTGEYSGVYVYTGGAPDVAAGDVVNVTAPVTEYNGLTELDLTAADSDLAVTDSADVPEPTTLDTGEAGQEAYEGVLVEVTNVTVTATPGQYGEWAVDDGSGELAVDDVTAGDDATPDETGASIDAVAGPLYYSFGAFKVQPTDVVNLTPPEDGDGGDGPAGDATTLTVLSYNDIQTAASDPAAMGRLVGTVNERRAAHDNPTVVVGGGDQISPSSLSPVSNWTVPVDVLNVLDPAAEVVGNHDLDYGFAPVANYSAASEFPWLVANVEREDGGNVPGTSDYTIVERDGVKVGVIGLVDDAIKSKTAVDFAENGYEVTDFVDVGTDLATELKTEHGVDVVVAAAHVGVPESEQLAQASEDIDVIVTGDDEVLHPPETVSGTVITEAQARGAYVGELNLTVEGGSVSMESGRLVEVTESAPVNETAESIVSEARSEQLSAVAGETAVELDSTFSANYHDETNWGNLVTDAFRAETGAEVAVTNAGGIRGDFTFGPGNVTYDDVYTSLPFGNHLVTKSLTGEQLRELLASQVVTLESGTGQQYGQEAQLQVSGVSYEYVGHEGADPVVTELYVNGEPVDENATYNVTVNSYMAGWSFQDRYGWSMANRTTVGTDYSLYGTVVAEYVEANSPVAPEGANRIRRVDRQVGGDHVTVPPPADEVTVEFTVPDAVESVNASTFVVQNASDATVAAEAASLDGDSLTVTFDADELAELAVASDHLSVYGGYVDAQYADQRAYFERSVLAADLSVHVPPAADPAPGGPGENPGNGPGNGPGDSPGNGPGNGNGGGPPFAAFADGGQVVDALTPAAGAAAA